MSDSLQHYGLQHARLPCPSLPPGVYSVSCPLNQWCYLAISSSAAPFSFCLQSFLASGSFPMTLYIRWQKYWSFSFNICPSNEYSGLISFWMNWFDPLAAQGTLKSYFQHHSLEASILLKTFLLDLTVPWLCTLPIPCFPGILPSLLLLVPCSLVVMMERSVF